MGNKCSCRAKKHKEEVSGPLKEIREAQRKYFTRTIENDADSNDGEYDPDDSVDLSCDMTSRDVYGSNDSMDTLDNVSVDSALRDSEDSAVLRGSGDSQAMFANGTMPNGAAGRSNGDATDAKVKVKKRKSRSKLIRMSKRADFYSILNSEDKKAQTVDPKMYDYPFENVVFEGGGNKGLAYCGCVRLLEELGVWPGVKRIAGSSAGAMTAALLVVGYDSWDLERFYSLNLNDIFLDHKFGYCSLLPNLLSAYGWNPGKKIDKWFGAQLKTKTNNADITFKEVYEMFGRELCVVVTNLNQMTSLYCHPKTTPDMPVRLAVRMSMSIPGLFQAVKQEFNGITDVFVDGGVLCNYPIHCFDGWWLSMEPEDSFLERLQPLEDIPRLLDRTERFGTFNMKTLGLQLYADHEQDLLKYQLENLRHGVQLQDLPNTKLAREKIKKKKLQMKTDREHRRLVKAMNAFLKSLRKHNTDKNDSIDRKELEAALEDKQYFPPSKREVLFGDVSSEVILEYLDKDHNGQISYNELVKFMEETGISMQDRFLGYDRRSIKNLTSFLDTLQATLLTNVKRVYVRENDLSRTVGINTGHVGTSDFILEPEDIAFIIERGRRSLEAFLKYYVAQHKLKKKPEFRKIKVQDSVESLVPGTNVDSDPSAIESLVTMTQERFAETAFQYPEDSGLRSPPKTKSPGSGRSVVFSDNATVIDDIDDDDGVLDQVDCSRDGQEENQQEEDIIDEDLELDEEEEEDSSTKRKRKDDEIILILRRATGRKKANPNPRPNSLPLYFSASSQSGKTSSGESKSAKVAKRKGERRNMTISNPTRVEVVVHSPIDAPLTPRTPLLSEIREDSYEVEGSKQL